MNNENWNRYISRFVYGLLYPGILAANLVLLTEAWNNGLLQNHIEDFAIPWMLMLILFVLDYSVTAPFEPDSPPHGTISLSIIDSITAIFFFIVHLQFGLAVKNNARLDPDAWFQVWMVFWLLHFGIFMWCIFAINDSDKIFGKYATPEKISNYKSFVKRIIGQLAIQVLLIIVVNYAQELRSPNIEQHTQFITATIFAIFGWFVRRVMTQMHEQEYKFWSKT